MPMQTFSRISGVLLFGLAACLPGSRIDAFEATDGAAVEKAPLQAFATPRAALRAGLEGFRSGDATSAIEALKYAAAGGELLAQWKLAKIYANGDEACRATISRHMTISRKLSRITMRTTRTGAISRLCRARWSRLGPQSERNSQQQGPSRSPRRVECSNSPRRRWRCERAIQFGADAPRRRGRRQGRPGSNPLAISRRG